MHLRHWRQADAPALLHLARTSTELERQFPQPTSEAEARALIEKNWLPADTGVVFCIDADGPAGLVGISYTARNDSGAWDRGWVYYWAADRLRGKGITQQAVKAVCDWALGTPSSAIAATALDTGLLASLPTPNLRRLELGYRSNNPASGAVAAYAGFSVEGLEREKFLYAGHLYDAISAARLRTESTPRSAAPKHLRVQPGRGVAAFHHVELWTENFDQVLPGWSWLLEELGFTVYQSWQQGISWAAADGSYLVLEESPDLTGPHQRTAAGLNHLAFTVASAAHLDYLRSQAGTRGWAELFADRYPYAGGPQRYALYLENAQRFEVELVVTELAV